MSLPSAAKRSLFRRDTDHLDPDFPTFQDDPTKAWFSTFPRELGYNQRAMTLQEASIADGRFIGEGRHEVLGSILV